MDDIGGGGHEVREADGMAARRPRLNMAVPARDEGDAVAPFENIGFVSAKMV